MRSNDILNSVNEVEEFMKIELKKKAETSKSWFKNNENENYDKKEHAQVEREKKSKVERRMQCNEN